MTEFSLLLFGLPPLPPPPPLLALALTAPAMAAALAVRRVVASFILSRRPAYSI